MSSTSPQGAGPKGPPEEFEPEDMNIKIGVASHAIFGYGVAFSVIIHGVEHSAVMTTKQAFELAANANHCAAEAGQKNLTRRSSWMN